METELVLYSMYMQDTLNFFIYDFVFENLSLIWNSAVQLHKHSLGVWEARLIPDGFELFPPKDTFTTSLTTSLLDLFIPLFCPLFLGSIKLCYEWWFWCGGGDFTTSNNSPS